MGCRFVQRAAVAWAAVAALGLRVSATAGETAAGRLGVPARAGAAAVAPSQRVADRPTYRLTRYTAEQGLPQNSVRALLQTREGYLWVGTLAGLARFDGVTFDVFNANNTPEMRHDAINALAEDQRDGSLWINTGSGLLRYREHRFERFAEEEGFPHPFGRLWPARDGGLWYSPHPGQLVRLQDRTVQSWQLRPRRVVADGEEIVGHFINQVEEEPGGSLLVLMHMGLFRFEPATGASSRLGLPGATDTSYRHFHRQPDGTVFVAAREGLWRGAERQWERIESVAATDPQCPARICASVQGELWVGWSMDGPPRIARFTAEGSKFLDLSGLPDYPMNEFLQDREGHWWLGTESGLCQLRPKAVRVYAREQGVRNDFVKSLTAGPDGTIWLGTDRGVSSIRDGQVTNLPPVEPPASWGRPEGLLADRRGRVWYGVRANTVATFEHGAWASPSPLSLGESWVRTLYEDRSGRIWAGFDRGVAWMDEAGAVQVLPQTGSEWDVRVIHQDRRGDVWFGTYGGGLIRLHDGQMTAFSTTRGEHNNRAWWIHEDAEGIFWVGTRNGLNRFVPPSAQTGKQKAASRNQAGHTNPVPSSVARQAAGGTPEGHFFTFTTQHGLHENTVNNIQEDDFGNLWLSGLQGIYRVARQELNAVAAGRQTQARVLAFGEADGMLNSQCNGGVIQPSGGKDRLGRIWFPTACGAVMVDPQTIRRNDVPPPVVVEQVKADGKVVYGDGLAASPPPPPPTARHSPQSGSRQPPVRLPPGRARVLEIHYTANSFAAPHRMRFKYRLEGVDRDWHDDDQNRRTAFYTSLWPGDYTFLVTACNNHDVWSEAPARFAFTLEPQFWQTWWFYALAALAIVGLAAAIQAYRLRWQRRLLKVEHQQALADERTRIARDLHDDLGTSLTGLALEVDVLRRTPDATAQLTHHLGETAARIRALAAHMREVVWAVNPQCDTVSSLASYLEQQAGQFLKADGLRCRLEFPEDIPPLPLDGATRHQLALGVREALTNAVRHAAATEIVLSLRVEPDQLVVQVSDDGRGFHVAEGRSSGHGLANLSARLARLGGACECRSVPGGGTTVELRVPLVAGPVRRPNPPSP
ncbi:MAG: hypothetical protein FJ387_20650 [Verrucomicrobia bacterium]|nr:hypothetical protein [Verrucomicrobiota bacterium]